ncbi:hypothetical protein FRC07_000121 [Ceratobasidium sp. 392]|nr:hypothetical protein FRC07_000121 [Ceratobasidium sp. 392]
MSCNEAKDPQGIINNQDDDGPEDVVGGDDGSGDGGEVWEPNPSVTIAKRPSLGVSITGAYLITKHNTIDFVSATIDYLRSVVPAGAAIPISHNTIFQVWRRFKLHHRRLPFYPVLNPQTNQVCVFTTSLDFEGRVLRGGYFNVVLFSTGDADISQQGLQRLKAGRVQAIFALPTHHQSLCSETLAYIERFWPFAAQPSATTLLYRTEHVLDNRCRSAIVVLLRDTLELPALFPTFTFYYSFFYDHRDTHASPIFNLLFHNAIIVHSCAMFGLVCPAPIPTSIPTGNKPLPYTILAPVLAVTSWFDPDSMSPFDNSAQVHGGCAQLTGAMQTSRSGYGHGTSGVAMGLVGEGVPNRRGTSGLSNLPCFSYGSSLVHQQRQGASMHDMVERSLGHIQGGGVLQSASRMGVSGIEEEGVSGHGAHASGCIL